MVVVARIRRVKESVKRLKMEGRRENVIQGEGV